MATVSNFFSFFKTKAAFTVKLEASEINENGITFIADTNEIYTHKTYYSCSVTSDELEQQITEAISNTIVQELGDATDKVMSQKSIKTEVEKIVKSITDLSLINEPVYNLSELLPTSGLEGGNTYDLSTALAQLDSLLDPEEKKSGIKVKFLTSENNWKIYTYEGSNFTSEDSWSLSLTDNDFDTIIKAIPVASPSENGLMSKEDKTKLDALDENINSKIDEVKETIDNYTVNGHKISENPALDKSDVGLDQVDNTSDLNKPVSTAQQEAIDAAKEEVNQVLTEHKNDKENPHGVTKAQVGLDKVDNTADIDKPVSTAQQAAINEAKEEVTQSLTSHTSNTSNPHNVTKEQVGLSNVTNDAQVKKSEMGVANGVATLDEDGKVPVSQLNGSIARVFGIEKAVKNQAALPEDATEGQRYYTIDTKKIYERLDGSWDEGTDPKEDTIYNFRKSDATGNDKRTNILYRWDGADLVEISSSIALGESKGTAYEGDKGKANRDAINSLPGTIVSDITKQDSDSTVTLTIKKSTKSGLNYSESEDTSLVINLPTKVSLGLDKVDNTADMDKPVSTAQQAAIDAAKEEVKEESNQALTAHIENKENPHSVTKAQVGLDQVDNTSDLNKPVSTAQQEAINAAKGKVNQALTEHTSNTSNPHNVTKAQVGLDKVDNTSDLEKPISTATQGALDTLTDLIEAEEARATGVESGLQSSIDIINGEGEGSIKKGDTDTLSSAKSYSDSLLTWFEGD